MKLSALNILVLFVATSVAAQEEQAILGIPDGAIALQGLSRNDLSNVSAELDAELAEDEMATSFDFRADTHTDPSNAGDSVPLGSELDMDHGESTEVMSRMKGALSEDLDVDLYDAEKWGGGRRRRRFIHVHHRHSPHLHHRHRPHVHVPHVHMPHFHHRHRPHIHVPHVHTAAMIKAAKDVAAKAAKAAKDAKDAAADKVRKYVNIGQVCSKGGPQCMDALVDEVSSRLRKHFLQSGDIFGTIIRTVDKVSALLSVCDTFAISEKCNKIKRHLESFKKSAGAIRHFLFKQKGRKLIFLTAKTLSSTSHFDRDYNGILYTIERKMNTTNSELPRRLYKAALNILQDQDIRRHLQEQGLRIRIDNRPNWLTTVRCNATTCLPCDKDVKTPKADGCWVQNPYHHSYDSFDSYVLTATDGSDFALSKFIVKMKCKAREQIPVSFKVKSNINGIVRMYWNKELKWEGKINQTEPLSKFSTDWKQTVFVGGGGLDIRTSTFKAAAAENELLVTFDRQEPSQRAEAAIIVLIDEVDTEFAKCEDKKVCLGEKGMAGHWNQEAKDLRESLRLQHQCISSSLSNEEVLVQSAACRKWIECLKATRNDEQARNYFFEMKALLMAMAAKQAPPLAHILSGERKFAVAQQDLQLKINATAGKKEHKQKAAPCKITPCALICRQKFWDTVCEPNKACIEATAKCKASIKEEERHANNALMNAIKRNGLAVVRERSRNKSLLASFKKAHKAQTLAPGAPEPGLTINELDCKHPWLEDPASWDCNCHEVMQKATNLSDFGSLAFAAAYRSQLCKNLNVCNSWKEEACCKDNDVELRRGLKELENPNAWAPLQHPQRQLQSNMPSWAPSNSQQQSTASKGHIESNYSCADLQFNCNHAEIGPVLKLNCPRSCGLCKSHMRTHIASPTPSSTPSPTPSPTLSPTNNPPAPGLDTYAVEASVQLDDALAATQTSKRGWTLTPTTSWTLTPTTDQSCFQDADGFDCQCHAKMQRECGKESFRKQLKVDGITKCNHFFVCTHSQTCEAYKKEHCSSERKLLKTLQSQGIRVETC